MSSTPRHRFAGLRAMVAAVVLASGVAAGPSGPAAETVYDCNAPENKDQPTTVEFVLAKKKQEHAAEIKEAFRSNDPMIKIRIRIFPFLDPPTNIGIGKCITAESARLAIREAVQYYGKVDRLIRQDILPHHWIKVGSTDVAELAWTPVAPDDLTRLSDPALSTEQFQALYRQLAAPKEKKLPFGMGSEKIDASAVEVLKHEWHPDAVWERIGKTKFIWKATVRNNSDARKRVYVYYDLLDAGGFPVARNVSNRYIEPHQTVEVAADSYILSEDLPKVKSSRATVKVERGVTR